MAFGDSGHVDLTKGLRRKIDRQEAAILTLRRKYRVNAERPQRYGW